MEFVWFALIGVCAGWLAGQVLKGSDFGLVGNLVIGVLGAILGGWLFGELGISAERSLLGALITAFVGAVVLLFLLGLVRSKK
ncbi:MAG: GlsB/YeaQ/YmgE family stress response membrane protein [Planctomycetes bacterium]|nr:GlsB/YeaQ/YmgE family stress response membrane protein [Planctomycetota bacterium]